MKTNIMPNGEKDPNLRYDGVKLKEILIPFQGFYETYAGERAEQDALYTWTGMEESGVNQEEIDAQIDRLTVDQAEKFWDWYSENAAEYRLEVARTYAHNFFDEIKSETGVDLEPQMEWLTIDSPRQYNFTTDRLFVKVNESKLMELYKKVDLELLAQTVKERFTSYDGFSSFYDNDLAAWGSPADWDHNQWNTVLIAICEQFKINTDEIDF